MYKHVKNILFQLQPEDAHHFVTRQLKNYANFPGIDKLLQKKYSINHPSLEREVFGIKFKNPVGLAAGFDKNGEYIQELSRFGFGFIEIGTVTPKPQPGNELPRMFRLVEDEAIINRMGFNNKGAEYAVKQIRKLQHRERYIIGGNIGKNKNTPNEDATNDYVYCFNMLFDEVDYFVVNVSSPNTPNLRELQEKEPLMDLLYTLQRHNGIKENPKPILLKIAPDLTNEQLDDIIEIVTETKIAGIIATNTTISREGLQSDPMIVQEMGGVSGKPLKQRSTEVIKYLSNKSNKAFPIIGVGGIHSPEDAVEKLDAGASLIQIYTGFIYEGPGLAKEICEKLIQY
ncbi:quinone-dependent dihydroorotate dehydrogenase [Faecalibacter rhinopitheci]|uniref:Dihydroorotate dehydrogenase (quinone) n=1 Tax=Faecalibacter rhinopitheci TaxID=2779678 RepID=A0A8J7FNZ5_9FLAO|nr:quinone-dependent dihydroorotate dehydrogenase [Faecalibacter rhinopitheci]MBF0596624.1 quinone-dependent dihydroorotate dehydrogenase [Faecalibacter rhinopitheci]MBQ0147481.1 quinone-dependent dihydroorotate dehydrogenase [Candidatus Onthonaster equi]